MATKRSKKVVLDVGTSAVRLFELSNTSKGLVLNKFCCVDLKLDPTTPPDERFDAKVTAIRELLALTKTRKKRTALAVTGQSAFIRTRTLPPVPESKVDQIVRYEIQQQIPFPLDQIALDFQIMKRHENQEFDVMMVAIKVDSVESFCEVITEAKLKVETVDVTLLADFNWLTHTGEVKREEETTVCINLGASKSELIIEREGDFRFNRTLNVGGNMMSQAIQNEFGITFGEAEDLKRERGVAMFLDEDNPDEVDKRIHRSIHPFVDRLTSEITKTLGFFRSQPGGGAVTRAVLFGGGAQLKNLPEFLSQKFGFSIELADPLAHIAVGPAAEAAKNSPLSLCTGLGIALRCVDEVAIEINLIPPRIVLAERRKEQAAYLMLSAVTTILIMMSTIPIKEAEFRRNNLEIGILSDSVAMYEERLNEMQSLERNLEGAKSRVKSMQDVENGRTMRLESMIGLDKAIPDKGVWITEWSTVRVMNPNALGAIGPETGLGEIIQSEKGVPRPNVMRVRGYAWSTDHLKDLIEALGEEFKTERVGMIGMPAEIDLKSALADTGGTSFSGSGMGSMMGDGMGDVMMELGIEGMMMDAGLAPYQSSPASGGTSSKSQPGVEMGKNVYGFDFLIGFKTGGPA
ncbi:type IV pilus assembly protein PilM [Candidatus Hydrogenedentota bacterium]